MPLPTILPMLATPDGKPFDSDEWVFEIKYDGYRIIAYVEQGEVRLKTRKNIDYTAKFPLITEALKKLKGDAILDGEIVVLNEAGVSDFNALQNYKGGEVYYYVFDLLFYRGKSYLDKPLLDRKTKLQTILPPSPFIRYCDHIEKEGVEMFEGAKALGCEGIIAKRINSTYCPGKKSKDWVKIKVMKEGEFLIAGLTYSASGLSSLILAEAKAGRYHYAGDVGTGFDSKEAKEIISSIKVLKKCPLKKEPDYTKPGRWGRKAPTHVIWCRPELRCIVKYLEVTANGELRHASFKGII